MMNNSEVAGWLVLWVVKPGEFDVQYQPRAIIKARALANFIAEFTTEKDKEEKPIACMIWTDSSSNQWARRVGVLVQSLEEFTTECAIRL